MRSVVVSILPSLGDLSKSRTLYSLSVAPRAPKARKEKAPKRPGQFRGAYALFYRRP